MLDELARALRLVDMGHVAVNSLNYVEALYFLGSHSSSGYQPPAKPSPKFAMP